jgi:hypothetical protein
VSTCVLDCQAVKLKVAVVVLIAILITVLIVTFCSFCRRHYITVFVTGVNVVITTISIVTGYLTTVTVITA